MCKPLSILLVEDDNTLSYLVRESLVNAGHSVTLAQDGEEALAVFKRSGFDLCLIDIMMPIKDGLTASKQIRAIDNEISLIFLTARQQEADKIAAFKNGADDYLVKPFSMTELLLRIDAIIRRSGKDKTKMSGSSDENFFNIGKYSFDFEQRTLSGFNEVKIISSRESDLLRLFCLNKNSLLNRSFILKQIWRDDDYFMAKTMDVFITRLRKLLKGDENIEIKNLYGTGFKMVVKNPDS